jgi:adenylate cyclase
MAVEIERKFLVEGDAWRAVADRSLRMRQGYLGDTGSRASARVRVQGDEARLNIKAAVVGRARAEYDYPMPLSDAQEILDGLCVGLVDKTRHYVEIGELTWEIDEFEGENEGLIVAEVELDDADQIVALPAWIGREVTEDPRYYNHALALRPYNQWRHEI